jgi:hypothetical protein
MCVIHAARYHDLTGLIYQKMLFYIRSVQVIDNHSIYDYLLLGSEHNRVDNIESG